MRAWTKTFGHIGVVETIAYVSYVYHYHSGIFTTFETLFFVITASFELAAEVVFLFRGLCLMRGYKPRDPSAPRCRLVMQDFLHVMYSWHAIESRSDRRSFRPYFVTSAVALGVAILPTLYWATFHPVWGGHVVPDEDRSEAWSLCVISAALLSLVLLHSLITSLGLKCAIQEEEWCSVAHMFAFQVALFMPLLFLLQKIFAVYLLASGFSRLYLRGFGLVVMLLALVKISSGTFFICYSFVRDLDGEADAAARAKRAGAKKGPGHHHSKGDETERDLFYCCKDVRRGIVDTITCSYCWRTCWKKEDEEDEEEMSQAHQQAANEHGKNEK